MVSTSSACMPYGTPTLPALPCPALKPPLPQLGLAHHGPIWEGGRAAAGLMLTPRVEVQMLRWRAMHGTISSVWWGCVVCGVWWGEARGGGDDRCR